MVGRAYFSIGTNTKFHWENKQGMQDLSLYSVYNPWLKQPRPGPGDFAETNIDGFFLLS